MEIQEAVLKVFSESEEPLRPGKVAEISGLDRKDVDKAIKQLKQEEKIYSPKRCFYAAK